MSLVNHLYNALAGHREPVCVFDVGCSNSGIGPEWDAFGSSLCGVGFDPLFVEIERLSSIEKRPGICYEAAFVGPHTEKKEVIFSTREDFKLNPFGRSSSFLAAQITSRNHAREFFNAGAPLKYTDQRVSIDDYVRRHGKAPLVLKVDTDGETFGVLTGAEHTITSSVVAVCIECVFEGAQFRYADSFSAIDTFLRERGFSLFALEPFGYTRAALPGLFTFEMFAQTRTGQVMWCDTVYLRDLADPRYEQAFGFQITEERVLQTACLMEMFDLRDCAAELLQVHASRLHCEVEPLLDQLVPEYLGHNLSYREYIARFKADPTLLFPTRQRQPEPASVHAVQSITLDTLLEDHSWPASTERIGDAVRIRASGVWAYAALLRVYGTGRGRVEVDVRVHSGRIGVAVLGGSIDNIAAQVFVEASDSSQVASLPVADFAGSLGLIFRNGTTDGSPSVVDVREGRALLRP